MSIELLFFINSFCFFAFVVYNIKRRSSNGNPYINKKDGKSMTEREKRILIEKALEARKFSYVPYSDFRVGAALLSKDGRIITGCNIENAAYSPTNCAERTAIFKAVSEGITEFQAIAIVGGPGMEVPTEFISPCGVCRQVMREFCDPETFLIILGRGDHTWKEFTLEELLPLGFSGRDLDK